MNQIDIAWMAGVIEGEGCFLNREVSRSATLIVAMSDEDVIQRLHQITDSGSVRLRKSYTDPLTRKPIYVWQVSKRRDLVRIMCAVAPLMGLRRRKRMLEVALFCQQRYNAKGAQK